MSVICQLQAMASTLYIPDPSVAMGFRWKRRTRWVQRPVVHIENLDYAADITLLDNMHNWNAQQLLLPSRPMPKQCMGLKIIMLPKQRSY